MAPKRSAPASKAATAPKKAKSAASKPASKTKAPKGAIDAVKDTAASLIDTVSSAVDVAGDMVLDDGAPAPVEDAVKETVDVPALKKKGKEVKGKAGKKAVEAVETTKPVKGKATKAAKEAAATVDKAAKDPKNRKRAEDFMEAAGSAAKNVAGKVGEALSETLQQFGEASGVTEAAEGVAKKGKKQAGKKGKEVAEKAVEVKETGKRKAKEALPEAEPVAKKTRSKAKAPEPVAEDDDDVSMHGFSSSDGEADSSDDESDVEDLAVAEAGRAVDMTNLPMVARDDKSVQARLKQAAKKKDTQKGTLYVGRIPHGFYEEQMKEYFSQFGDVTRLRLARNRKTGASKHYAYIEMSSQSVAQIVAETMNNYLLMGHLLKCHVIAADKVHPQLWAGANKKFRKVPRARVEKMRHEKERTEEEQAKADKKLLKKQNQRKSKLQKAGIDYEFEGHA
ncbi:hypothetical protein IAR50_000614 [Cryptococcus sp. DSM 104548]